MEHVFVMYVSDFIQTDKVEQKTEMYFHWKTLGFREYEYV